MTKFEHKTDQTIPKDVIASYQLSSVRYYDDHKLPFQLLQDISEIIESHTIPNLNFKGLGKKAGPNTNGSNKSEFQNFYAFNKSGIHNMVIYLFWEVLSVFFSEICFPSEFIDEVKQEFQWTYKEIYFKYLLRLKRQSMDALNEFLPFFLT